METQDHGMPGNGRSQRCSPQAVGVDSAAGHAAAAGHEFIHRLDLGGRACGLGSGRVLLAVSGGADSTAMLRGLASLGPRRPATLMAAHLDHGLRTPHSRQDAEWLQSLTGEIGIPFHVERRDVAAEADASRCGIEETARRLRYQFLEATAVKLQCATIAVAHTRDDQAETVLHHLLRGTGLSGLAGIPRRRQLDSGVTIVRPLLDVSRCDVLEYLKSIGQPFREDVSNHDCRFTRNRIRRRLLPLLRDEFNPQVEQALLRLAHQAADVQDVLLPLSQQLLDACLLEPLGLATQPPAAASGRDNRQVCRLDCTVLREQPRHLVRECFRRLWYAMDWPRQKMGFDEWEHLADLGSQSGAWCLPGGVRAERRDAVLRLER